MIKTVQKRMWTDDNGLTHWAFHVWYESKIQKSFTDRDDLPLSIVKFILESSKVEKIYLDNSGNPHKHSYSIEYYER